MRMSHSVVRSEVPTGYVPTQSEILEAEASKFLASHGFRADARPKGERSQSVKAVSTPCGGKPDSWKKWR